MNGHHQIETVPDISCSSTESPTFSQKPSLRSNSSLTSISLPTNRRRKTRGKRPKNSKHNKRISKKGTNPTKMGPPTIRTILKRRAPQQNVLKNALQSAKNNKRRTSKRERNILTSPRGPSQHFSDSTERR